MIPIFKIFEANSLFRPGTKTERLHSLNSGRSRIADRDSKTYRPAQSAPHTLVRNPSRFSTLTQGWLALEVCCLRSGKASQMPKDRHYICGGGPAGAGIWHPCKTTAAMTPNIGWGTGCTFTSRTAGRPESSARFRAGRISSTDSTRSP